MTNYLKLEDFQGNNKKLTALGGELYYWQEIAHGHTPEDLEYSGEHKRIGALMVEAIESKLRETIEEITGETAYQEAKEDSKNDAEYTAKRQQMLAYTWEGLANWLENVDVESVKRDTLVRSYRARVNEISLLGGPDVDADDFQRDVYSRKMSSVLKSLKFSKEAVTESDVKRATNEIYGLITLIHKLV